MNRQNYFALLTLPVEARPNTFPAYGELQVSASISGEGLLSLAREWPDNFQETRLRTKDGYFVEPWVIMLQAINHATENREQIKSMLSSLGVTPPDMDGWDFGEATNALMPIAQLDRIHSSFNYRFMRHIRGGAMLAGKLEYRRR